MSKAPLSAKLDWVKAGEIRGKIDENSKFIKEIVDSVVAEYLAELDDMMSYIRDLVSDYNNPPDDETLDMVTIELPNLLYYAGEGQEFVGIKEDIATAIRREVYNKAHLDTPDDLTVDLRKSMAEDQAEQEFIVEVAYQRAYKIIRGKMQAGYEQLASIKKVISRRMSASTISQVDSGAVRVNRREYDD